MIVFKTEDGCKHKPCSVPPLVAKLRRQSGACRRLQVGLSGCQCYKLTWTSHLVTQHAQRVSVNAFCLETHRLIIRPLYVISRANEL